MLPSGANRDPLQGDALTATRSHTCFTDQTDFAAPLIGDWVDSAELLQRAGSMYGWHAGLSPNASFDAAGANKWRAGACFAETAAFSCAYHGIFHSSRATNAAQRRFSPRSCRLLPLRPRAFATQYANTSFYFWGDSLARQAFISFVCNLQSIVVSSDIRWSLRYNNRGPIEPWGGSRFCPWPDGRHCHFTQASVTLENGITVHHEGSELRPSVALRRVETEPLDQRHVIIATHGTHFTTRNAAHLPGFMRSTMSWWNRTVARVTQELPVLTGTAGHVNKRVRFIWRESAPAHFSSATGEYEGEPTGCGCTPGLHRIVPAQNHIALDAISAYNKAARTSGFGGNVDVLRMYEATLSQWDAHVQHTFRHQARTGAWSNSSSCPILSSVENRVEVFDCLHFCVAGVPDAWNQVLYTMLMA